MKRGTLVRELARRARAHARNAVKFSAVLGTMSSKSSNSTRPAARSPTRQIEVDADARRGHRRRRLESSLRRESRKRSGVRASRMLSLWLFALAAVARRGSVRECAEIRPRPCQILQPVRHTRSARGRETQRTRVCNLAHSLTRATPPSPGARPLPSFSRSYTRVSAGITEVPATGVTATRRATVSNVNLLRAGPVACSLTARTSGSRI